MDILIEKFGSLTALWCRNGVLLLLTLGLMRAAEPVTDWTPWTVVKGDADGISGGVDFSWKRPGDTIFYRFRNRFSERIAIDVTLISQDDEGRQNTSKYSGGLVPGQIDDSRGNWATGNRIVRYVVNSFSFPDVEAQKRRAQQAVEEQQRQQAQSEAEARARAQAQSEVRAQAQSRADDLRRQQARQQQARIQQQQSDRQRERQQADREWQREQDARMRETRQKIDSIVSATSQRTNAINSAADQLIAMVRQRQEENEARRELEELQREQREHEEEQRQAEREMRDELRAAREPDPEPIVSRQTREVADAEIRAEQKRRDDALRERQAVERAAAVRLGIEKFADNILDAASRIGNADAAAAAVPGSDPLADLLNGLDKGQKTGENPALDGLLAGLSPPQSVSTAFDKLLNDVTAPAAPRTTTSGAGQGGNSTGDNRPKGLHWVPARQSIQIRQTVLANLLDERGRIQAVIKVRWDGTRPAAKDSKYAGRGDFTVFLENHSNCGGFNSDAELHLPGNDFSRPVDHFTWRNWVGLHEPGRGESNTMTGTVDFYVSNLRALEFIPISAESALSVCAP